MCVCVCVCVSVCAVTVLVSQWHITLVAPTKHYITSVLLAVTLCVIA